MRLYEASKNVFKCHEMPLAPYTVTDVGDIIIDTITDLRMTT